jgi:hypothetical protein
MAELHGAAAAAVIREWPSDITVGGAWPLAKVSDGTLYGIAWRYLLSHE